MKYIMVNISSNRTLDDELMKAVRSKSKEMKRKYDKIHSLDVKGKDLLASVTQIKGLNSRLGGVNDRKLAGCLREMERKIEGIMEMPVEKPGGN